MSENDNNSTDTNNIGLSYIIGLGDYENGELSYGDDVVDIKRKFLKFDGDCPHHPLPHVGDRFSIVYYTSEPRVTKRLAERP